MTKVLVLKKGLTDDEIASAVGLAVDAQCDPADISTTAEIGDPETMGLDEVVLVLLVPANCEPGALDAELGKVPSGGRRAISIWPSTAQTGAIPDAVGKFSYSIIGWDPKRLREVISGQDVTFFEGANGEPLPQPNQDHLECE